LYNLPRLAAAGTVIVAEGEKCCDTLTRFGFTAGQYVQYVWKFRLD
jgi:DNA primase